MSEMFLRKINDIASFDCDEIHYYCYLYNSLRENMPDRRRGKTLKRKYKVADDTSLASLSWMSFLEHEKTKRALSIYLSDKIKLEFKDITFFLSVDGFTYNNKGFYERFNHEEADTMIIRQRIFSKYKFK